MPKRFFKSGASFCVAQPSWLPSAFQSNRIAGAIRARPLETRSVSLECVSLLAPSMPKLAPASPAGKPAETGRRQDRRTPRRTYNPSTSAAGDTEAIAAKGKLVLVNGSAPAVLSSVSMNPSELFSQRNMTYNENSIALPSDRGTLEVSGANLMYEGARVKSWMLGRDLNPGGRGYGNLYPHGMFAIGKLRPRVASTPIPGFGNSINNGDCPEEGDMQAVAGGYQVCVKKCLFYPSENPSACHDFLRRFTCRVTLLRGRIARDLGHPCIDANGQVCVENPATNLHALSTLLYVYDERSECSGLKLEDLYTMIYNDAGDVDECVELDKCGGNYNRGGTGQIGIGGGDGGGRGAGENWTIPRARKASISWKSYSNTSNLYGPGTAVSTDYHRCMTDCLESTEGNYSVCAVLCTPRYVNKKCVNEESKAKRNCNRVVQCISKVLNRICKDSCCLDEYANVEGSNMAYFIATCIKGLCATGDFGFAGCWHPTCCDKKTKAFTLTFRGSRRTFMCANNVEDASDCFAIIHELGHKCDPRASVNLSPRHDLMEGFANSCIKHHILYIVY